MHLTKPPIATICVCAYHLFVGELKHNFGPNLRATLALTQNPFPCWLAVKESKNKPQTASTVYHHRRKQHKTNPNSEVPIKLHPPQQHSVEPDYEKSHYLYQQETKGKVAVQGYRLLFALVFNTADLHCLTTGEC